MKVILLQDVRNVGRKHDVKEVSDGYAANFLFPRKLAEAATTVALARIEAMKKAAQAETAAAQRRLDEAVDSLRGKKLPITARATEKGGLFKAIDAKMLVQRIKEDYGIDFPLEGIAMEPFKTVGEHTVKISSKGKTAELTLVISAVKQ